jgi:hypothetical protein
MRNIVTIKFGSHLYGTTTPNSDLDFKSVYIPDPQDILLQRVKGSINKSRPKAEKEKNLPGEIEEESYSLQRYLELLSEGQTVALDMLFAPQWSWINENCSIEWAQLLVQSHRLLTRKSTAFVGYCRQQANKYGIKGSRVAAARLALKTLNDLIEKYGTTPKLAQFEGVIAQGISGVEHMLLIDIPLANGTMIRHWDVCNRKLPFTSSIKNAYGIVQRLVDEYGQRALQAESQQGVDWKALSHAVRVGAQALEFLATANVTFPLPNAAHILAIKLGQLPYQEVSAEIEQLLVDVEVAATKSSLPDKPDYQWIDDFVARVYRDAICHE